MSDNINILLFSDLHLSQEKLTNQRIVLSALYDDLRGIAESNLKPQYIVFAGDLVDDPDQPDTYLMFLDEFLLPLVEATAIKDSRIFFVPGNHDVSRTSVKRHETENAGILTALNDQQFINRIYQQQKNETFILERQNSFFATVEAFHTGKNYLSDPFVMVTSFEDDNLTMIGINTAIFSMAGTKGSERDKLPFPDIALNQALHGIPQNHFVVGIHHHPINWLTETSGKEVRSAFLSKANLHVFGHLHDPEPKLVKTPAGSLTGIQLPSLFSTRNYHNGYSIISISRKDHHIKCIYRTYWDARRRFDKGVNIAAEGVFFPTDTDENYYILNEEYLSHQKLRVWINDHVRPHLVDTLDECSAEKPLSSIFVEPPIIETIRANNITTETDFVELEQKISLQQIAENSNNYFILVPPENGQTSLAKRLAAIFLKEQSEDAKHSGSKPRVPVILDAHEIKFYDANIFRRIKAWLPETVSLGYTSQSLITQGFITFIIENLRPNDDGVLQDIEAFRKRYPKCQYIHFINSPLLLGGDKIKIAHDDNITKLEVRPFNRSRVRKLVELWGLDKSFNSDFVVEQIITRFRMLSIPITAVNISIFLTVIETVRGFVPINTASLIENYIDITLEKYDLKSTFRGTFDYKNKIDFLAHIASKMVEQNQFRLDYSDFYAIADAYFKSKALNQRPQETIEYFVGAKILESVGTDIQFRLDIFQSYFIAQSMIVEPIFKNFILTNFARFIHEIEIYCGLQRGDASVIEYVGLEFEKATAALFEKAPILPNIDDLDSFVLPTDSTVRGVLERITNYAFSKKLTKERKEKLLENSDGQSGFGDVRQRLARPEVRNTLAHWVLALRAYSFCIKNLELIDGTTKDQHTRKVLHGWAQALSLAVFLMRALLVEKEVELADMKFVFETDVDELTPHSLRFMFLTVPIFISYYMRNDLGSEKLDLVLRKGAGTETTAIEFLRACLFLDLRLTEYPTILRRLIKTMNKSRFLLEALIMKIRDFYLRTTLDDTHDDAIRKIMVDIFQLLPRDETASRSKELAGKEIQSIRRKKIVQQIKETARQFEK